MTLASPEANAPNGRLGDQADRDRIRHDLDATLFVETREAFEPPPVGCAELQGRRQGFELGEGRGRTSDEEITVYKAMGHVMEDIVAAELVYARALESGAGVKISL